LTDDERRLYEEWSKNLVREYFNEG
jgi:hypothetical protein